jgi:hypothetical protein
MSLWETLEQRAYLTAGMQREIDRDQNPIIPFLKDMSLCEAQTIATI